MTGKTMTAQQNALAEGLKRMPDDARSLVTHGSEKIGDAARRVGRSVTDLAHSAGSNLQQALPAKDAITTTTVAVASAAALQAAQRGLTRLATRQPLLFVLGGLAIVGGIVLARRSAKAAASEDEGGKSARDTSERSRKVVDLEAEKRPAAKRAKPAEGRRQARG